MNPQDLVTNWYESRDPMAFAEDIDFNVCDNFPLGGKYHGRAAVYRQFFGPLREMFAEFSVRRDHVFDVGDGVIVIVGKYIGRVKPDAPEFAAAFTHMWRVVNGEVVKLDQHAETATIQQALAAQ